MILPLLLALQSPIAVVELPEPTSDRVRFEIVARLEVRDARDWAAANVLREVLPKGTDLFTESELFAYVTQMGDPMRVTLAADHLRIGFSLPPGGTDLGAQVVSELVRSASLPQAAVQAAMDDLPFRQRTAWAMGWLPKGVDAKGLTREDVTELYRQSFRPKNVTVAVGGKFLPGSARSALESRFASWASMWKAPRLRRPGKGSPLESGGHLSMRLVTLEGPIVQAVPAVGDISDDRPSVPEAMLVCAMLGQGKGATLFEVLREKLAVSYRQEAFIAPDFEGLRARIVFASSDEVAEAQVRGALTERIRQWTESDRLRAIRFAEESTRQEYGLGTLYLSQERPLGETLEDRTFLNAYWVGLTGRRWNPPFADMRTVPLDRARALALRWMEHGTWVAMGVSTGK